MLSAFVPCVVLAFVITLAGLSNAQSSVCTRPAEQSLHVLVMEPGAARDGFFRSFLMQRITALDAISDRLHSSPLYSGTLLRARYQNTASSCLQYQDTFGSSGYDSRSGKDTNFPASSVPVTSALKYAVETVNDPAQASRFSNDALRVIVLFVETLPTTESIKIGAWSPDDPSCNPAEPSAAQAEAVLLKARVGLFVFASSNDVAEAWKSYFEIMKKVPFKVASLEDIKEEYESLRDSSEKRDFVAKTVANAALSMACEPQNVDVHKSELDEETTYDNSEREDDDNESTPPPDNTPSPSGEAEKDDKDDQEKPPVFEPSVSEKAAQQPTTSPTPTEPTTPTLTKPTTPAPTESTTSTSTKSITSTPTKPPTPAPTESITPTPTKPPSPAPTESTTPKPTKAPTPAPTESTTSTSTESTTLTPAKPPTPELAKRRTPAPTESTTPPPAQPATPPPTQPASTATLPANCVTRLRSGAVSAAQVWLSVLLTAMAISTNTFLVVVE